MDVEHDEVEEEYALSEDAPDDDEVDDDDDDDVVRLNVLPAAEVGVPDVEQLRMITVSCVVTVDDDSDDIGVETSVRDLPSGKYNSHLLRPFSTSCVNITIQSH